MTEILSITRTNPEPELLERVRTILAGGGLVIVPTETVYGIACDPAVPGALNRLIAAKGRDGEKPIARHPASSKQVQKEATGWNNGIQTLADRFWPGPLTLVLETEEGWTGYRIPDHPTALALANTCGHSLALTSANLSGEPDTKTAMEAAAVISADLIIDSGPSAKEAIPSTVVKIEGNQIECLREGCLPFAEVEQFCLEGSL
jgi:L-threonylcarbamoyladenylate synthase